MTPEAWQKHWQTEINTRLCPRCSSPQKLISRREIKHQGRWITVSRWRCETCNPEKAG